MKKIVKKPVVGQEWEDTKNGEVFRVDSVDDFITFSNTPGQKNISGGCHCVESWRQLVSIGEYRLLPNSGSKLKKSSQPTPYSEDPYSEAWWAIIEEGRYKPAGDFGATTGVMSQVNARAMVIEAVNRLRNKQNH